MKNAKSITPYVQFSRIIIPLFSSSKVHLFTALILVAAGISPVHAINH